MWLQDSRVPVVMGVLNVTPDSFSDGGRYLDPEAALVRARRLAEEGADLLDVGGESTRPGAEPVSAQEEMDRVLPVLERVRAELGTPVSIDTSKAAVARAAVRAGAVVINDVTGARDPEMASVAAESGAVLVVMHMRGEPRTMQQDPRYPNGVVTEVRAHLADRIRALGEAGIPRERLWVDPGIGFGKTLEHNLELLRDLDALSGLGERLVVGASRKRFLSLVLGAPDAPMEAREAGTLASHLWALTKGATVFRVHEPGPMKRALKTWEAIRHGGL